MAATKKRLLEAVARRVDGAVSRYFVKEQVMTSSHSGKMFVGEGPVLYRWKSFPVLLDEEGMLERLLAETGDKKLVKDFQLVKLARERKFIP